MWPFKSKVTLKDSTLLANLTDWHSHILPGVDDGVETMEESLEILKEYEDLGVKKVWLTPHIMEDYPNETEKLKERFEELKKAWEGNLEIALASENMLDTLFESRLENNDFLPIGEEGNHLLVETSYFTPPYGMDEMLANIQKKGYYIILAHPERYRYMEEKDYKKLKDMGVLFQMNYLSLVGAYGETARKKGEWLLKKGYINYLGSDIHRIGHFRNQIEKIPTNQNLIKSILEIKAGS